jgi:uncharacterized membrane protein
VRQVQRKIRGWLILAGVGVIRLRDKHLLLLLDVAVAVRHPDGSFTSDGEPSPVVTNILGCSGVGFLAGLILGAPPLTSAAVGALLGGMGTAATAAVGISDDFIREGQALMKPGSSALFILDSGGDMDVILHAIRGLGSTILKTNVDLERARLIQSTLAASTEASTSGSEAPT